MDWMLKSSQSSQQISAMNLKEARNKGNLKQFVKEREKHQKGDKDKFEKAIDSMTHPEKLKSTQETSSRASSES